MLFRIRPYTACSQPVRPGSKRRRPGTIRRIASFAKHGFAPISRNEEALHVSRRGAFPGTGNTPLASLFGKTSSPGLRDPECDRHRWMDEIMLHHFLDSISRWFLGASFERRDEYLAQAKTIDELERRMRDADRWLGP